MVETLESFARMLGMQASAILKPIRWSAIPGGIHILVCVDSGFRAVHLD